MISVYLLLDYIYEARLTVEAYVGFYNNHRLHSGIEFKTLQQKWNDFEEKVIAEFNQSGEVESGVGGGQPARNNPMNDDESGGATKTVPFRFNKTIIVVLYT